MKRTLVIAGLLICAFTSTVTAQVYNQNITAIFGTGNPDTGWAVGAGNGMTLAMRAKDRVTASTANVDGVYNEAVGTDPSHLNRARWNFEFSINSGAPVNLDAYDFYLSVDTDTSVGINRTIINALAGFSDDAYGNDSTVNGGGLVGTADTYASIYNIAQQSQNIVFYGLDPNVNATYDYELYAVEKGAGPASPKLASVTITVVVGTGGATVQQLIDALAAGATNHGDYVTSVNDLLKYLNATGVINKKEKAAYLSTAAQSNIGN